jgi:hypothetical protein
MKGSVRNLQHCFAAASFLSVVASVMSLLFVVSPTGLSQSVTGQISGTVTDPAGAVVVGARVQLTHDLSQQVREFQTESSGSFVFTGLVPGTYRIRIAHPGFKTYEQNTITVATQERVDLHEIRLDVGDVTSSVEVSAQSVHVATDSSDRSVGVNLIQIEDTPIRGRDFLATIKALPGVQDLTSHDARGWGVAMPTINGGQMGQTLLNLDGIATQDSGNLNPGYMAPSVDAIGEVRLVVSNFTAEYGGRTGGQLQVSIKGGSNQFHGSAYYYWRHEQFNANEFFNNAQGIVKPRYRYQNPGGTIGGPLIIPGTNFNKSRTKLFFFFSVDSIRNKSIATNRFTMPTALERTGDFSQTVTSTRAPIAITDPTTQQPFPGNKIPANRTSPAGQAFMNLFPLPNAVDPSGTLSYNYIANLQLNRPNDDKILRVDYNLGQKTITYARLLQDYQAQDGYGGTVNPIGGQWGQFPASYHIQAAGAVGTVIHTFSPTLINEFTWGINRGKQGVNQINDAQYQKSLLPLKDANGNAISLPSIFGANTLNLLPTVSFCFPSGFSPQTAGPAITGASSNTSCPNTGPAPNFGQDTRWPFVGTDTVQSITNKVTWIKGDHTIKAGFYYERMARNVAVYETYQPQGTYYFGVDKANPVDTGYPYSNLLTGGFFAYGEDNKRQINHARYNQEEWFVQDSWKLSRRVTVDYGVRFFVVGPLASLGGTLGIFSGTSYSASKAGQLLYPAMVNGQKAAVNLVTGTVFPYIRQGTFDTSSYAATGIPFSGINQYQDSFFHTPPVQVGPRIGLAWDIFGNGKTALRAGFGITYGRPWNVDMIGAVTAGNGPLAAPPNLLTPLIFNSTFTGLAGAQTVFTPQNVLAGSPDFRPPAVYNWSVGIQRDIGHGMILEVAYVGNVAHRIANSNTLGAGAAAGGAVNSTGGSTAATANAFAYDANAVPPLTTWTPSGGANPKYLDPTSAGGTGAFYSANLIRALTGYAGYGTIYDYTFVGESYYDALQTSVNKRFSKGFQFGVNYTWSKAILYQRFQFTPDYLNKNVAPGNRPHAVNFNFGYDLPDVAGSWNNAVARQLLRGWRLYGNGTIFSGTPIGVACSVTGAPIGYWTGTPTGGLPFRCQMATNNIADIWLPSGQYPSATADPKLQFPFNKSEFTVPPIGSLGIGNTPPTLTYGPGVFNVDLALAKEFHLGSEARVLELKAETFNTLNHFNPGNPNSSLTLNFASGANTNAAFGTINYAQVDARRMILSARFRF